MLHYFAMSTHRTKAQAEEALKDYLRIGVVSAGEHPKVQRNQRTHRYDVLFPMRPHDYKLYQLAGRALPTVH